MGILNRENLIYLKNQKKQKIYALMILGFFVCFSHSSWSSENDSKHSSKKLKTKKKSLKQKKPSIESDENQLAHPIIIRPSREKMDLPVMAAKEVQSAIPASPTRVNSLPKPTQTPTTLSPPPVSALSQPLSSQKGEKPVTLSSESAPVPVPELTPELAPELAIDEMMPKSEGVKEISKPLSKPLSKSIPKSTPQTDFKKRAIVGGEKVSEKKNEKSTLEEKKEEPSSVSLFSFGLGVTSSKFISSYGTTVEQFGLTPKLFFSSTLPFLSPRIDFGANTYMTAFSLMSRSTGTQASVLGQSLNARYVGANARLGYNFTPQSDSFLFKIMGGYFYSTMLTSPVDFGYKNVMGPQIYPTIGWKVTPKSALNLYGKYSPLAEGKIGSIRKGKSRELAFGLIYTFAAPLFEKSFFGKSWGLAVDYSDLKIYTTTSNTLLERLSSNKTWSVSLVFNFVK